MKKDFFIRNIKDFIGKEVTIKGWVFNKRSSGSIIFLQVRDGSGFIQAIAVKNEIPAKSFSVAQDITLESSVILNGLIREEKRAPGGYEMLVKDMAVISLSDEFPIGKKEHGPDFLLTYRHLWLRSKRQWAIQRIRNVIIYAIYNHLESEGFIKIDAPILTPTACEGTTTLFPVPYLPAWKKDMKNEAETIINQLPEKQTGEPFAYLSQSGQLYLEAAIMAHGKVFDFGPTFRAEKSKTRRHLSEFWMMDAEAAFVEHKENMVIQEKLIVAIVEEVLKQCRKELEIIDRDTALLKPTLRGKFPVISHQEAIKLLNKKGIKIGLRDDFGAEAETVLSNQFDRPFFVERYPKEVKAFYMKQDQSDSSRVLNNDMLAPEGYGEIIGGSQREDDYEKLLGKINEVKLNASDFDWYLDLRKYGSVPHSGFGIGLERIVAWICRLEHIRESIPFPRMLERFRP